MSSERIALAIIAGSNALEEGLPRLLKSVEGKVDGVYIGYTASEDGIDENMDAIFDVIDPDIFRFGTVSPIGWTDDFAEARNASFDLVRATIERTDTEYDWIIWLDCDDVIPEHVDLRKACAEVRARRAHGGFMQYEYQYDDANRSVLSSHYKERIFRADVNWTWIYPIHENCIGPMGTRMTRLEDDQTFSVRHLRGEVQPKRERNRRIVKKWFEEEQHVEPRAVMYMAHETFALADEAPDVGSRDLLLKAALKLYRQFIDHTPSDDDSYACNRQAAEILMILGRYNDAINIDLQGVKMNPTWPASYVGIATTHHAMGDYEGAIKWARLARNAVEVPKFHAIETLAGRYKPFMIEGDSMMKLGDFEGAVTAFKEAREIHADDFTNKRLKEAIAEADRAFIVEVAPAMTLRDQMWGSSPEKSIAFFVPPSIEDWNPEKFHAEGLGGTETCVIRLAQTLADRGWRVVIFGSPGEKWDQAFERRSNDGSIEWYRSGAFHPDEPFTVFVALRDPTILDAPIKAQKKILWLHDVAMGDVRYGDFGDRFSRCDTIVCVSPFAMEHIVRSYKGLDDRWTADNHVIWNGFDSTWFRREEFFEPRDMNRIVYASSPDRGLPRLLDLWPAIADRVPYASLHIYYGWESIDAIIEKDLPTAPMLRYFKERTIATIDKLCAGGHNIVWHGRVNQEVLGEHFLRSGVMAYPANFMETFGIVFAQAMMAGVVPVVPQMGNLPALLGPTGLVVPGSPDSQEFGPRFVDAIVAATLVDYVARDELKERVLYFEWETITNHWEKIFKIGVPA